MVLIVRFLLTIFRSPFRSRIGALDESKVRFTVLPWDCDLNIHLNAGRFVSFMDVARVELLGRMRILRPLLKKGWRPVMGGALLRYRRSLLPFERFVIRSRVLGWDEKWFYLEHVVEKLDGTFCAVGSVRTLIRSKESNIRPADVLALMNVDAQSPPLPRPVLEWRALEDAR